MPTQTRIFLVDNEPATIDDYSPFLQRSGFKNQISINVDKSPEYIDKEVPELIECGVPPPLWEVERLRNSLNYSKGSP